MSRMLRFIFLVIALCYICPALAEDMQHVPPAKPVLVKVGFYLTDITHINEPNETISFMGNLRMQWRDPRLAGRYRVYVDQKAQKKFDEIWHPHLKFKNERGDRSTIAKHLVIESNGTVTVHEWVRSKVRTFLNYRKFPFDTQQIVFAVEPFSYPTTEVKLVDWKMHSGVTNKTYLTEWYLNKVQTEVKSEPSKPKVGHYSSYNLVVTYERASLYYLWQVIVPMILIVLLSFGVFWMLDQPLVNRVAISLTAILAIVVFQWRIFSKLPHVGYHTFLDVLMLFSFIVACMTVLVATSIHSYTQQERSWALRLRWIFPTGFVLGLGVISLIYL